MSRENIQRWQPPDRLAPGRKIVGYIDEIVSDGEGWLESQPFWSDLDKAEDLIRGKETVQADQNRSDLTSNRLKRILREIVAAISDVRYPDVWSSDNKAFSPEAAMFSKVAKASRGTERGTVSRKGNPQSCCNPTRRSQLLYSPCQVSCHC